MKTSRASASDEHNFVRSGSRVEDGVGEGGEGGDGGVGVEARSGTTSDA